MMRASAQDRWVSGLGTAIIVALLGYALVIGMNVDIPILGEQPVSHPLTVVRIEPPKPPPIEHPKMSRAIHKASPANLRAQATPVVAPPPIVRPLPVPPPIVAAVKPAIGVAAASGASDHRGAGEGAGGQGDGNGGGGDGDGDGGVPPRQIKGRLKYADLPQTIRDTGVSGTVSVRYDVDAAGRVGNCAVTRSSGNAELDRLTCALIQQRFRFDPSRDADGRAVDSSIEEDHRWDIDGEQRPPPNP